MGDSNRLILLYSWTKTGREVKGRQSAVKPGGADFSGRPVANEPTCSEPNCLLQDATGRRNPGAYRFEYCGRLRALRKPTFLRSTSRASRVTKPAPRSVPRSESS